MEYIADSIKVALGIGKLLFVGHSRNHYIVPYAWKTNIAIATFFDLAVYQVSFRAKTWYLHMWKFRVIFTCEKITVAITT